jgi:hypothetical protein
MVELPDYMLFFFLEKGQRGLKTVFDWPFLPAVMFLGV